MQACVESVNSLITDLVQPSTEVGARHRRRWAKGDLTGRRWHWKWKAARSKGEFLHTPRAL